MTAPSLVEKLKALLPDPTRRIELIDLMDSLTSDVVSKLSPEAFPVSQQPTEENVPQRVGQLESITDPLARALVVGGYYGDMPYHHRVWTDAVERLADAAGDQPTGQVFDIWDRLRYYPALIGVYALGLGALMGDRPEGFAACLAALGLDASALSETAIGQDAIERAVAVMVPNNRSTGMSAWLEGRMMSCGEGVSRAERREVAFDQVEYLIGLIDAHHTLGPELNGGVYPRPSQFWFRARARTRGARPDAWATGRRANVWVEAGFFDSSSDRLREVKTRYDDGLASQRQMVHMGYR